MKRGRKKVKEGRGAEEGRNGTIYKTVRFFGIKLFENVENIRACEWKGAKKGKEGRKEGTKEIEKEGLKG
jgi:hypothetical protein